MFRRDHYDYFPPEPPEEMNHAACNGEGCAECGHSGIDPVMMREQAEMERDRDAAMYEAYLERISGRSI